MPRKKSPTKSSETRYSATPAKASTEKEASAKSVETKHAAAANANATNATAGKSNESTNASAAAALIGNLRHSDADSARDAATSLGALADASAVQPLIEVLNNTDGYYHAVVRAAAAASLGRIGDRRAVEPLIDTIRDSLAEPSSEAIRALAAIGDTRAINPLIEVVRNQDNFFLSIARRAAVLALAKFQSDPRAAAELRTVSLNNWEDPVIRQAATDGISKSAK